ncbi:MAG: SPOR domain-containing protein [Treponema sp.]|jgi:hypothetical protein|nr:SPOR domain-containing protein [Treponema sp.]
MMIGGRTWFKAGVILGILMVFTVPVPLAAGGKKDAKQEVRQDPPQTAARPDEAGVNRNDNARENRQPREQPAIRTPPAAEAEPETEFRPVDLDEYEELIFEELVMWRDLHGEIGESGYFKMSLTYEGPTGDGYTFLEGDNPLYLPSEETELDIARGEAVTVYFTATGPLNSDWKLDEVIPGGSPPAAALAREISWNEMTMEPAPPNPPKNTASAPSGGAATQVLVPSSTDVVISINRENNGDLMVLVEPRGPEANAYPPNPGSAAETARRQQGGTGRGEEQLPLKVIPQLPPAGDRKIYRIQVGSFVQKSGADTMYRILRNAGLSPVHEKYKTYNRIVIPGIPGTDVASLTRRLSALGITEIWLRQ